MQTQQNAQIKIVKKGVEEPITIDMIIKVLQKLSKNNLQPQPSNN